MVRAPAETLITTALLFVVLMVSACSSTSVYTPVDERSIGGRQAVKVVSSQSPDQYRVRRGDTLYSIAFRYGLDFRELARHNNISNRYKIYPGQVLSLKASPDQPQAKPVTASSPKKKTKSSVKTASVVAAKPVKPAVVKKTAAPAPSAKPKVTPAVKLSPQPVTARALKWRWPASGQIIQRFSNKGKVNKGINFAGRKGEPVFAAESGKVVYAGSGLLGYGNLVIIHHNQKFLSAYAHNSRILVKENDKVKIGDKIAEIGNSGAARTMLHFEIRRDGQPVDPMLYLPRKR
ncbi:peptidoglycan DD-metalloendopeptidase family protein [Amphritea sp.]|uniref:peptidoglycan DD-metalloendopeptidase family protein n=1 Tax=Amphritea sp. TaxID=1872502 RepID=UPI003A8D0ABD